MQVTIQFVFLRASMDVNVFEDAKEVTSFQVGKPSSQHVAGNAVEIKFSDATVERFEGLPVPLMNAALTLQGRLGNHEDVRSPAGEGEVMHAVKALRGNYVKLASGCLVAVEFLRVQER